MPPLRHDAVRPLLAAGNSALVWLARRDLLDEPWGSARSLWDLPEVHRIVARQQPGGGWRYSGGNPSVRSAREYDQLETYRQIGVLIHKFCLDHRHPAIDRAAEFLRSFQTPGGDYRGIYGNQYTPNYTAAITELLISAGYGRSPEVRSALRWLMSIRQDDGGWAIPTRTLGLPLRAILDTPETLEPDRSRPSSHLITGIVLRALVAHPQYRRSPSTHRAGELLKSRFFTRDTYPDHVAPSFWLVFSYPFWWTDLLSALDSLTRLGFAVDDPDISRGVNWFIDNQHISGLWNPGRNRPKGPYTDLWVALAVCRVLKRCLGADAILIDS